MYNHKEILLSLSLHDLLNITLISQYHTADDLLSAFNFGKFTFFPPLEICLHKHKRQSTAPDKIWQPLPA